MAEFIEAVCIEMVVVHCKDVLQSFLTVDSPEIRRRRLLSHDHWSLQFLAEYETSVYRYVKVRSRFRGFLRNPHAQWFKFGDDSAILGLADRKGIGRLLWV